MSKTLLSFLMAMVGLSPASLVFAQQTDQPVRTRFGVSGSVLRTESGDERCSTSMGFGLGAEVRTRGEWLLATGVDFLATWGVKCLTYGIVREYEGQQVEVFSSSDLPFAPRATLRAGRAFPIGKFLVEPAGGVGLFYQGVRFPSPPDAVWSKWYGGSVTLRVTNSRWGAFFEYGWREVPVRYYASFDWPQVAYRFGQREPLFRFGLGL